MEIEEALTLAAKLVCHCDPALFENFFSVVKGKAKREWNFVVHRKVALQVPSYSDTIIAKVRHVARRAIKNLTIPQSLREKYGEAITIIPSSTTASRDVAFGRGRTKVPTMVAILLGELITITPSIATRQEVEGVPQNLKSKIS